MTPSGILIVKHLGAVKVERAARAADPALADRVGHLKRYQQARFEGTYADLLCHPRYAGATRFFLDDLYGPGDFTQRDAQFTRIVPALVRLFPEEIVDTVAALAALHALSERLDSDMARHIDALPLNPGGYERAWRLTGQISCRERQIHLTLDVGRALDVYTHRPMLRHTLRAMRMPARAAGMGALQSFLERGFDSFRAMGGANWFLREIVKRENSIASALFGAQLREIPHM